MSSIIGVLILVCIVGLLTKVVDKAFSTKSPSPTISPTWEPPKADPLPYARRKYFFSAAERSFYEILRRLVPDYTVFAKVRLVDVVRVSNGSSSRRADLNRIDRKHLDFVLCDQNLAPVLAVELDDSSHDDEKRKERDEFVDRVLVAAAFPIVHIRAQRSYQLDEVRRKLAPHIKTPACSPTEVTDLNSRYAPPVGWRPAV